MAVRELIPTGEVRETQHPTPNSDPFRSWKGLGPRSTLNTDSFVVRTSFPQRLPRGQGATDHPRTATTKFLATDIERTEKTKKGAIGQRVPNVTTKDIRLERPRPPHRPDVRKGNGERRRNDDYTYDDRRRRTTQLL